MNGYMIENMAFDEIERTITDGYLASYKEFKFNFAKMNPSKKIYDELKKNDNWADYDYSGNYDKYCPNWEKKLRDEYKRIEAKNPDPLEDELEFLESDVFSDVTANIAAGIIETGIKDLKNKEKKMRA